MVSIVFELASTFITSGLGTALIRSKTVGKANLNYKYNVCRIWRALLRMKICETKSIERVRQYGFNKLKY